MEARMAKPCLHRERHESVASMIRLQSFNLHSPTYIYLHDHFSIRLTIFKAFDEIPIEEIRRVIEIARVVALTLS